MSLQTSTRTFVANGFICHNSYSRRMPDGRQERWPDTVLRVVDGVFSSRKDFYLKRGLEWDDQRWQDEAERMARIFLTMRALPPGRGLFAMGTEYVRRRGSMALFNCASRAVSGDIAADLGWVMDLLMCGVGTGIEITPSPVSVYQPAGHTRLYVVPDSREGWVESEVLLLRSYMEGSSPVEFDYSLLRSEGSTLHGLGGTSAGPEPLRHLHAFTREACERYIRGEYGATRLKADLSNMIAKCVVMGGIRHSATLLLGSLDDPEFVSLKDYEKHPERAEWGWASNNSVVLETHADFLRMPEIAAGIRRNGEPGFVNRVAMQKFARFGREVPDAATQTNPCGEICLENSETCNVGDVFPSRCADEEELEEAVRAMTLYTSTVAMLPTHRPETNRVVARNRRIGVSVSGLAEWIDSVGMATATRLLRDSYKVVCRENARLAAEAGVPESVRKTTVKPGGSVPQLVGATSGASYPWGEYTVRRMRVGAKKPVTSVLRAAGYAVHQDPDSPDTAVVEFPVKQPAARRAADVSMWEQALLLTALQREWSDNAVSVTITYSKEEARDLERLLAAVAPMVKSACALPRDEKTYALMPVEEVTREEYERRRALVKTIDWDGFLGDGQDEKYCQGDKCDLPPVSGVK